MTRVSKKNTKKNIKKTNNIVSNQKDIEAAFTEEEAGINITKSKKKKFRKFLLIVLITIGVVWFVQFRLFLHNTSTEKMFQMPDFMKEDDDIETSGVAEIVDFSTGEIAKEGVGDLNNIQDLKQENMPDKISEDFGEFNNEEFDSMNIGNNDTITKEQKEKIEQMEKKLVESSAKIDKLEKELEKTNREVQFSSSAGKYTAPLIIQLINLKEKLGTGEQIERDVDNLEYLANGDTVILNAVQNIKKYIPDLPTKFEIFEIFESSTKDAMKLYNTPKEGSSLLKKIIYNLTQNIVVRRIDEKHNLSDVEKIINRAENLLKLDKYQEAVSEIQKLEENYLKFYEEWIVKTSKFIYVDQVLYQTIKYTEENK